MNRRDLVKTGGLAAGAVVLVGLSAKESVAQRNPSIEALQIVTNGLAFDALTCGPSTGELVLLLHGFPAYKETWTAVLQGLGALGYYAVAPDQRGYSVGARPDSPSEYVLANLVSDVVGFAEFLNAKKFHLVGHDMGGTVGWAVAAQHGDQLLSTTILSTPHKNAFVPAYNGDPDQMSKSSYIVQLQGAGGVNFMLGNNAANLLGSYQGLEPNANLFLQRFQKPGAMQAALNWYVEESFTAADGMIVAAPVTYIWGSGDLFLGKLAAVNTANFVTGLYNFIQLPGRSHWLMNEVPQDIITVLHQQFQASLT